MISRTKIYAEIWNIILQKVEDLEHFYLFTTLITGTYTYLGLDMSVTVTKGR